MHFELNMLKLTKSRLFDVCVYGSVTNLIMRVKCLTCICDLSKGVFTSKDIMKITV